MVLGDIDIGPWHFNPPAPALERLIELCVEAFERWGDPDAGRKHAELLRGVGIEGNVRTEVLALLPRHPYLGLPLQMATGLGPRLRELFDADELERLHEQGEAELRDSHRWGTTFMLLQSWGSVG